MYTICVRDINLRNGTHTIFIHCGKGGWGYMLEIDYCYSQNYLEKWILSKLVDNGDTQILKVNSGLISCRITCDGNIALVNYGVATHGDNLSITVNCDSSIFPADVHPAIVGCSYSAIL